MKNPALIFASLAVTGALVLTGCSTSADDAASADSIGTSVETVADPTTDSSTATSSEEVQYDDLDIKEMDLDVDVASAVSVTLADGASSAESGVVIDGDTVTITEAGTYVLSGTLSAGSIIVNAPDEDVTVILDGVDVTAAGVGAFNVVDASNVLLYLADGSQNSLADASGATVDETDDDAPNAAVYSTADLWFAGSGSLDVTGANDGITSKDSLVIASGNITVTAVDDGVRGKDHLVIRDGSVTVDAGGDALKADNEGKADDPDAVVGVIWIEGGTLDLTAGSDAVDAARQVTVNGGDLTIAAGDDGLHSDGVLRIDGGTMDITESYEGIEGVYMYLSGGDVVVVASDDGINVSGGAASADTASSGDGAPGEIGGGFPTDKDMPTEGTMPDRGEMPARTDGETGMGGGMGGVATAADDISTLTITTLAAGQASDSSAVRYLEITGGTYVIDSTGDGVDSNGDLTISGGTLVVLGPEGNGNGALDVDGTFTLNGGTVAASGSSGMVVTPAAGGDQGSLAFTFDAGVPAETVITISDSSGSEVGSITTTKLSQSLVFSSDHIVAGDDYTVTVGGTATGESIGGLILGGSTDGGDDIGTTTASS